MVGSLSPLKKKPPSGGFFVCWVQRTGLASLSKSSA